jgi:hypothetical protein
MFMVCVEFPETETTGTEAAELAAEVQKAIDEVLAIAFPQHPYKVNQLESPDQAASVFRYRLAKGANF